MAGLWPAGWAPAGAAAPVAAPMILTLALPPALQRQADAWRAAGAAAHAPAHISLFRHLPGLALAELLADVRALADAAPGFALLPPSRRNGLWWQALRAPAADALRDALSERWHRLLAPGDKAPPILHLSRGKGAEAPPPLPPGPWVAPALLLWRYGQPCWEPLVAVRFRR